MYTKNYDSTNRMQFAYFNGTPAKYAIRVYFNNAWSEWYDFARIDALSEYFRNDTNGNNYIFSRYEYPRATIIETADGDIILRSSISEGTYNQIRISDTSMYIDWVASGEPTVTKKIIDKND